MTPPPLRPLILGAPLLLLGCGATDYGLKTTPGPSFAPDAPVDLTVDLALQRNGWGENTTRCQAQVAFLPDEGIAVLGAVVRTPDAPGGCATTELPAADPEQASGGADDTWQVTGGVLGPAQIRLYDGDGELPLAGVLVGRDRLRYEWEDCSADAFPTSRVLGLDVPAATDPDGVHALTLPELVAVGPMLHFESPGPVGDDQAPAHDPSRPLEVTWSMEGADPALGGQEVAAEILVKVYSQDLAGGQDRWLVCAPLDEGWLELPAEELEWLTDGRLDDPERFHTHIDVHSEIRGEGTTTPWGELVRPRAHISDGGPITFRVDEQ
jgi:hypothetical protein